MNIQNNLYSENLSKEKLDYIKDQSESLKDFTFPLENINQLHNFCHEVLYDFLQDKNDVNTFMHNKIMIDGHFLNFAKESNIEITKLYKGPIVSWKLENNDEKFIAQGIFLIKTKNVEFLHCAFFRKGVQNEDEITFFVMVSSKNYEKYVSLKNDFEEYCKHKDSNTFFIKVVDGEEVPYKKDHSWGDIFLPDLLKNNIKKSITEFVNSKDFYLKNDIPWKQTLLFHGLSGVGKSTLIKVIMSEFNFQPITVTLGATDEVVMDAFGLANANGPSLLYFEHLDILLQNGVDHNNFISFLDNLNSKNGVLIIATIDDLKNISPSLMDRASRFNKKFEIPLPTQEMAHIYIKKCFGNMLSLKKIKEIAKNAEKLQLSYAFLKQFYVNSMYEALAHNRSIPSEKDINISYNKLIKDRSLASKRSISTVQYTE
jgi:hypothetical protein